MVLKSCSGYKIVFEKQFVLQSVFEQHLPLRFVPTCTAQYGAQSQMYTCGLVQAPNSHWLTLQKFELSAEKQKLIPCETYQLFCISDWIHVDTSVLYMYTIQSYTSLLLSLFLSLVLLCVIVQFHGSGQISGLLKELNNYPVLAGFIWNHLNLMTYDVLTMYMCMSLDFLTIVYTLTIDINVSHIFRSLYLKKSF